MKAITMICIVVLTILTINANAQTYTSDFSTGYDHWSGDFADYPVTDSVFYELAFLRTNLPKPLDTTQFALKINGNNHSDDLFMFIKRKITGLLPKTSYQLFINVDFASKAPTNAIGVGGPPGEGVTLKAGATLIEPVKVNSHGFYIINIDKSNQSQPGIDMDTIGHVGVSEKTTQFTLINRNNAQHLFTINTNASGEVWVCIGTDSGFEATTTLYYKKIILTFTPVPTGIDSNSSLLRTRYYQIRKKGTNAIEFESYFFGKKYGISDLSGRTVISGRLNYTNKLSDKALSSGLYYLKIEEYKSQSCGYIQK